MDSLIDFASLLGNAMIRNFRSLAGVYLTSGISCDVREMARSVRMKFVNKEKKAESPKRLYCCHVDRWKQWLVMQEMRSGQSSPSPGKVANSWSGWQKRMLERKARESVSKCAVPGRTFPAGQARVTAVTGDVAKESQHEADASRNLYTARTGHAQVV